MKKIKYVLITLVVIGLSLLGYSLIQKEKTMVGFVNYDDQYLAELTNAKNNFWIQIGSLDLIESDFSECKQYDVIFLNHIGKLTPEQLLHLKECMQVDVKVHVTLATSPEYKLSSFTELELDSLMPFMQGSGKENQFKYLNYLRKIVDKKSLFTSEIQSPTVIPQDVYFRMGEEFYEDFSSYVKGYQTAGLYKDNKPFLVVTGAGISPQNLYRSHFDSLITRLESKGYNVVAVAGWQSKLELIQAVKPAAVINFPHGRFDMMRADSAVKWLKKNNVLYFTPQMILSSKSEWEQDKRGMIGGLLGQNIVVPELDGGIAAYALSTQEVNETGFAVPMPLMKRVERFVTVVDQWLAMRTKPNQDKRVVIYYLKSAGKNAMVAGGLEVGESLFNVLKELQSKGFNVGELPKDAHELLQQIQSKGSLFDPAEAPAAYKNFMANANPLLIPAQELERWIQEEIPDSMQKALVKHYGKVPGEHYVEQINGVDYVAIPRLQFGNVILTPVMPAALGVSDFVMTHGVEVPPPYSYIASYLWTRKAFNADVMLHFGAHGSVEFIPGKQVVLSDLDWSEVLTWPIPHLYIYSIDNIGEAMMAKRRTYATMLSHLTPAMTEAEIDDQRLEQLNKLLDEAESTADSIHFEVLRKHTFALVDSLGLRIDLGWKDLPYEKYGAKQMADVSMYLHHLADERIPTGLHAYGESYSAQEIYETVVQMGWPSIHAALTPYKKIKQQEVRKMVREILNGKDPIALMPKTQLERLQFMEDSIAKVHAKHVAEHGSKITEHGKLMSQNSSAHKSGQYGKESQKKGNPYARHAKPVLDPELESLRNLKAQLQLVLEYKKNLQESGPQELVAFIGGLHGGFVAPGSGGDVVGNPNAAPTGKNLFGIDAESTPSVAQWEIGKKIAKSLVQKYVDDKGEYPRKMAYSLWGGEFIRNQGMEIAQILYLLGVEPVRNTRGRVYDVKLIPIQELGRPRIDVVVQTSGQFRDIGGSRIALIQRAIALATEDTEKSTFVNYVQEGTALAEKELKDKGVSPLEARRLSQYRVFGGLNGNYGTGIMGMVENGEKWDSTAQLARQYLNNMSSTYTDDEWGSNFQHLFKAQLARADVVVHPRSSNATGPISLDHVYEFMGGVSAAIKEVTGKDPEGYFSDNRNKHNPKVQGLEEAIWTEARTTMLSKKFLEALMQEGPSAAEGMAENFRNTYGWNSLKPSAIDSSLWQAYYAVFVQDSLNLKVPEFFEKKNPFAHQEMTGVLLETIRKGMWKPDSAIIKAIAASHAESIKKHTAGCSEFVCGNPKLIDFVKKQLSAEQSKSYTQSIENETVNKNSTELANQKKVVLEKQNQATEEVKVSTFILIGVGIILIAFILMGVFLKRKSKV